MSLVQTVAPTVEPITLDEAKLHLRVDDPSEDALIESLITAAREQAEEFTRRQLCTATWRMKLDWFPCDPNEFGRSEIVLPKPPLQSVTSITYVDADGATQTLSSSLYTVDTSSEPARLVPAYGEVWPTPRSQADSVTVTFVAGYGAASAVPASVKAAMKLLIGHLYENRQSVVTGTITASLPVTESLLNPYRIFGGGAHAYRNA